MTEKESLDFIVEMIENAKANIQKGSGAYFLLWGYLVSLAGLTNFIFYRETWAGFAWLAMLPLGFIGEIFIRRKMNRHKKRTYTYTDRIVGGTWLAFSISMGIMLIAGFGFIKVPNGSYYFFYIILLLLAALALYISGVAYRFKPLKFGAIACWVCAASCFFVPWRYNILLYVIGFVIGYIIPGHLLIRKDSKANENV